MNLRDIPEVPETFIEELQELPAADLTNLHWRAQYLGNFEALGICSEARIIAIQAALAAADEINRRALAGEPMF